MLETDLKRLGRKELIEALQDREDEIKQLRAKLAEVEKKLADRELRVSQAGSIAEAALSVSGVFEAAEKAAAQYLENIQRLNAQQEAACRELEKKSREEAERLLSDARKRADTILSEAQRQEKEVRRCCEQLLEQTKQEVDDHWNKLFQLREQFSQSREELEQLLTSGDGRTAVPF